MKKTLINKVCCLFLASISALCVFASVAQGLVSPRLNANVVEIEITLPNAQEVLLCADWLSSPIPMSAGDNGRYYYRSEELSPGFYTYTLRVDGVSIADPSSPYVIRNVGQLYTYFIIAGDRADNYRVQDVPHGSVTMCWYHSQTMDCDRRMMVYTPAGYEDSNRSYPVLYLLHGMGGDEMAWNELGRATMILDNLIALGSVQPMIVVMPNGNSIQQSSPAYTATGVETVNFRLPDSYNAEFEKSFGEIIHYVDTHYRTYTDASHRAIAGLSMGGYHSHYISANMPHTFSYVGLFSPAVDARSQLDYYSCMDEKLQHQKNSTLSLYWVAIGKTDFLYEEVVRLRERFDDISFPYIYFESDGGHVWGNWQLYLTHFLPMLFR